MQPGEHPCSGRRNSLFGEKKFPVRRATFPVLASREFAVKGPGFGDLFQPSGAKTAANFANSLLFSLFSGKRGAWSDGAAKPIETLGFVGLGVMGASMCANLVAKSGRPVFGFDTQPEAMRRLVQNGVFHAARPPSGARPAANIVLVPEKP
jgi:hypothetical protein